MKRRKLHEWFKNYRNLNYRNINIISGQKINIMKKTKYLGMVMDEYLTFKNHMDNVKLKLNRANCLLAKLKALC